MDTETGRIRALNDDLRHNLTAGTVVMTQGVAALGHEAVDRIVKTICVFDDFCNANDPYEEHDFGSFEAEGHTIFFKIDYFDSTLHLSTSFPRTVGTDILGLFPCCNCRLLPKFRGLFRGINSCLAN